MSSKRTPKKKRAARADLNNPPPGWEEIGRLHKAIQKEKEEALKILNQDCA
jgi:hypothetical protein